MNQKKTREQTENLIQTDSDGFIFKVSAVNKEMLNQKFERDKKTTQKNKSKVKMQEFAELYNGLFVKLTHKTADDMYYAEVLAETGDKPISYLYLPKSYIKSIEHIPVIENNR
jgi:hypothetical protein